MRGSAYSCAAVILLIGLGLGLLYMRLSAGPLSFGSLPDRVAESIAARIGPGWSVTLRNTALELRGGAPALRANGLDVRDPDGGLVLRAPYALVSVDALSLLAGNLQPKAIEVRDLQLRVLVDRDGALSFSPVPPAEGGELATPQLNPASPPIPAALPVLATAGASPVSNVVGSLLELVVGPQSILNSLDRAQLTNARLVFVDADQRQRASFNRLDATFDWADDGGRRFSAGLEGPQGAWQLTGDVDSDGRGGYRAEILADGAPIQDMLLLAGLSALPATTDLEFSGRVDVAHAAGRVTELRAKLSSKAGVIQVDDKDTSPAIVEGSSIEMSWDENAKALDLTRLHLRGGGNDVTLQGRLTTKVPDESWRLSLAGKDLLLSGAAGADAQVHIADLAAELSGPDGITVKSVKLRGPDLSADIDGHLVPAADPSSLNLRVRGAKTNIRTALRLWPEAVAPPVRKFLVGHLNGGLLDAIDLKVAMSGADMTKAVSGGPIPAEALRIDFAISDGTLTAAEGLPPLSQLDVTGAVSGLDVRLRAPVGKADMDGRFLEASDGTFVLENYWKDDATAFINFRLTGGADGVGALLQQPLIHDIAGFEIDPATMKGSADLNVKIALPVKDIPRFVDLPISVTGTMSDLVIDKVFGKDRLEGAKLAIAYDKGDLTIKGDGKLGGSAANIDLQKNPAGGEANVTFSLDDAGRAKRGMSFGSQLNGTFTLKVVVPLGDDAKAGMRVEADLTKAAIDQLIPGWVKPAGRAAKLSFTMAEGATTEIRDLQLDSGSVQLRGTATLMPDGALDKADLSTFKLSPGDDMRAQVDRTGGVYKVVIRGNTGDARPFAKSVDAGPTPGRTGAASRDAKDFDLDLNLNILTGFNDEAITNATVKTSVRKDNIRQLDMKGRLGATNLTARTVTAAAGSPQIVIQSDNAGSLLRFLDIYKRMTGGDLVLQMGTGDGPQAGNLIVRDFALSNEPALRRIIPTQTQIVAGQDRDGNAQAVKVDINAARFSKARVDFTRTAGRLDFKDAAVFGSQVGFTLGGFIDNTKDRMDISGTFVPAYGLNNAFAQVPLFGPLLGGGQYEGLFAVNFRVSGPVASPTLTVNPLSAVAPGFLRKLFGAGGEQPTGSLPTTPER